MGCMNMPMAYKKEVNVDGVLELITKGISSDLVNLSYQDRLTEKEKNK